MTAGQIISEIRNLPAKERGEIIRFVQDMESKMRMSGSELTGLAEKLAGAKNPAEANRLREEIAKGFYGTPS
jgi:hypothetical protein